MGFYKKGGFKNKKKNKSARDIKLSIVFSFVFSSVFFFLIFTWLVFSPIFGQENLGDYLLRKSYTLIEKSWAESNEIVSDLAHLCSQKEKDYDKVSCVYAFLRKNVRASSHHKFSNTLRTPKEILKEGGICRDVSVFACSVFFDMGLNCSYVFEPSHVYNKVSLEDKICYIDVAQGRFVCSKKEG